MINRKNITKGVLTLLIGILLLGGGYFLGNIQSVSAKEEISDKKIALVNQDIAVTYQGKKVRYSDSTVREMTAGREHEWEIVSEVKAEKGMENNDYAAIVKIPSNYSQSIISIGNKMPNKAEIRYTLNTKLTETQNYKMKYYFENVFFNVNKNLNYTYTYGIFEGIHDAQAKMKKLETNNQKPLKYMEEISDINLLDGHEYKLKDNNEDKFSQIDITKQIAENEKIYKDYNKEINNNVDKYEGEYKEANNKLAENASKYNNIFKGYGTDISSINKYIQDMGKVEYSQNYAGEEEVGNNSTKYRTELQKDITIDEAQTNNKASHIFDQSNNENTNNHETVKLLEARLAVESKKAEAQKNGNKVDGTKWGKYQDALEVYQSTLKTEFDKIGGEVTKIGKLDPDEEDGKYDVSGVLVNEYEADKGKENLLSLKNTAQTVNTNYKGNLLGDNIGSFKEIVNKITREGEKL